MVGSVFCARPADGNDGRDEDESGGDDAADKGDDVCRYNDRRGSAAMKRAVALRWNWNGE